MTANENDVNENGYYTLYASDGTYKIYEIDGETMTVVRKIFVTDPDTNKNIPKINELEYVDGFIYANIWYKDIVIKIDPETGYVVNQWDLGTLFDANNAFSQAEKNGKKGDCLNGIAYDRNTGSFYFTGKDFYLVFKVKLDDD